MIATHTGARVGEILALNKNDINIENISFNFNNFNKEENSSHSVRI